MDKGLVESYPNGPKYWFCNFVEIDILTKNASHANKFIVYHFQYY